MYLYVMFGIFWYILIVVITLNALNYGCCNVARRGLLTPSITSPNSPSVV